MSQDGFISKYIENTDRFYRTAMGSFTFYKKLMGTRVIRSRVKSSSKYQSVFGAMFTSENIGDEEVETTNIILLINKNDMFNVHNRNIESIIVYDRHRLLEIGDTVVYERQGSQYKFKVTLHNSFSEIAQIIHEYTLTGIKDNTTKDGEIDIPTPGECNC